MSKKLIPLVIDRKRWIRGEEDSMLLNNENRMCCLGFACRAIGVRSKLVGIAFPSDIVNDNLDELSDRQYDNLVAKLGTLVVAQPDSRQLYDSDSVSKAVQINDQAGLSDAERENKLRPVLRDLGFRVTFTGPRRPLTTTQK